MKESSRRKTASGRMLRLSRSVPSPARFSKRNTKGIKRSFCDKVFRAGHSPPHGGGVDATSRRYREASFEERTGWSLTRHISECVQNTACDRRLFLMAAPYRACAG